MTADVVVGPAVVADPLIERPTRGVAEFARQGRLVGVDMTTRDEWAFFMLEIPSGRHAGRTVEVAAQVPPDFPDTPPPGPHVRPAMTHPAGAVHASPLGPEYVYWSRPAQGWARDRTTKAWVRHVRSLFGQT